MSYLEEMRKIANKFKEFGVKIEIENEYTPEEDGYYSVSVNGKCTEPAMTATGVYDALRLMSAACKIAYETGRRHTHKIF